MLPDAYSIRSAVPDDAARVIVFFQKLYGETPFMLFEVGESVPTEQQQRQFIADGIEHLSSTMQLCFAGSELVGVCFGFRGFPRRQQHSLHVVLGVVHAHWGRGIGTRLMQAVEVWAIAQGFRRLDLSVHANNPRATRLYERMGFLHEGTKKGSLIVNGGEVDEQLMAKRLPH